MQTFFMGERRIINFVCVFEQGWGGGYEQEKKGKNSVSLPPPHLAIDLSAGHPLHWGDTFDSQQPSCALSSQMGAVK